MLNKLIDQPEETRNMPPLFMEIAAECESVTKGKGRKRSYRSFREMADKCRKIQYVLVKDDVIIMTIEAIDTRAKWEGAKIVRDLLKRNIANECRTKYCF